MTKIICIAALSLFLLTVGYGCGGRGGDNGGGNSGGGNEDNGGGVDEGNGVSDDSDTGSGVDQDDGASEDGDNGGDEAEGNGTYTYSLLYTKTGPADSLFGWSVSGSGGDVDGDGVRDFFVGAPSTAGGTVYAYSGVDGGDIYSIDGADGSQFGYSLDALGADGQMDEGYAAAAEGTALSVSVLTSPNGAPLYEELSVSGSSPALAPINSFVAGIGDINGDGRGDFLVGDYLLNSRAGRVTIYSELDKGVIRTHDGSAAENRFGWAVSGTGDLNGDEIPDYIVGAIRGGASDGKVYVYSGSDGSLLYEKTSPDSPYDYGYTVSGAGDIDGDGTNDFLVGAIERDMAAAGRVYLYSGATGDQIGETLSGSVLFGRSLADAGDLDGDGRGDFIVGDTEVDTVFLYSGATRTRIAEIPSSAGSLFGFSVDGLGDIDGDGRDDFIVGAPLTGSVSVYVSQGER